MQVSEFNRWEPEKYKMRAVDEPAPEECSAPARDEARGGEEQRADVKEETAESTVIGSEPKTPLDGNMTFASRAQEERDFQDLQGEGQPRLKETKIWMTFSSLIPFEDESDDTSPVHRQKSLKFRPLSLSSSLGSSKWCPSCHLLGSHPTCPRFSQRKAVKAEQFQEQL